MTNKFDLKTQMWHTANATLTTNIGGAIPAGKTRFLTYIRVERLANTFIGSDISNIEVGVASRTTGATDLADDYGSIVSDTHGKLILKMSSLATAGTLPQPSAGILRNEVRGSIEQPILSVAGGKHMILGRQGNGVSASVFAQYYDE